MRQMTIYDYENRASSFSEICASVGCEGNVPAWPDSFGRSIKEYLSTNGEKSIRTLSLFSGAGGLDIGFSDVGFEIVESVEIEEKFCKTLELNSGEGKRFAYSKVNCIDIREYTSGHLGSIDFIIGGPPCQTFSAAGRRANGVLGTTDARGVLFREYVRLLQDLSPAGFLFENVYGIVGAQGGEPWREILESFSKVGYQLFYRVVDAADYGVPQHRERLLIVGLKDGKFRFPRPTHGPDSIDEQPFYNAETAVSGVQISKGEAARGISGRYGALLNDIPPGLNYSFYTEEMGHPNPVFAWRSKFSDFLYKADPNQPVRTIKAQGGAYTGPFHWENRSFSYGEYKRLQTFPDDYQISGTKQIAVKQIGNSVPPQLARMMAIAIRSQVFGTEFPFELSLLDDSEELTFRKRKRDLTAIYRKKAENAIRSMIVHHSVLPETHKYYCTLQPNFDYKEVDSATAHYRVEAIWGDTLQIFVHPMKMEECEIATITVTPSCGDWGIGADQVILHILTHETTAFTVAWKAFEHELIRNAIKADLVQLNGYYQTTPKIVCHAVFDDNYELGDVLKSVLLRTEIASMVSTEELARLWHVSTDDVIAIAERLRMLGYEVRNHNTNPQIAEGMWLIPYIFPTLTKQSVQLRKRLR